MSEGQTSNPPSLRNLILITLGAGVAATLLTVLVVLPAEFGRDPTGFGRLTGLKDLASGAESVSAAHFYDTAPRSDVIEIPFVAAGDASGHSELEYKVRMKEGGTLTYSWEATGAQAEAFYYDLHSETDDADPKVIEYKQGHTLRSDGALVAPVDGVHGWYWQNKSATPVTVRLRLSGFYELIPPGAVGNKAGILPANDTAAAEPPAPN